MHKIAMQEVRQSWKALDYFRKKKKVWQMYVKMLFIELHTFNNSIEHTYVT